MEALVCVPTYNERENIGRLLAELLAVPVDLHVLVVDDGSPDGTGDYVEEVASREPRVHVIRRSGKMGLGTAYITAFKWALSSTDASFVFEMDADFSHDPSAIPEFLKRMDNADVVVGSRYVNGITVMNWPLSRLILSISANIYTRLITGMPLHDATGGYKCFRREVLAALPLDDIGSDGYSFQIEMNYHAWRRKFRVVEMPIIFADRLVGASKMSRRIIWEAVFLVWKLRLATMSGRIP